jgi:hypothetical protein
MYVHGAVQIPLSERDSIFHLDLILNGRADLKNGELLFWRGRIGLNRNSIPAEWSLLI